MNTLSIDVGNSEIKGIGSNSMMRYQIPNVIARVGKERTVHEIEQDMMESLHIKISEPEFGEECFTVGKLAMKNEFSKELNLNADKSNSQQSLIMLLTIAALDAVNNKTKFQMSGNTIFASYNLSLGLPISQSSEEHKKSLHQLLKRKYQVEFLNTKNLSGIKVDLEFLKIQVNIESFAAYATMLSASPEISEKNIMIYDLGGLTNDVSVVLCNQVSNELSKSYRNGLAVVLDVLLEKLNVDFNYRINSRHQLLEILKRDCSNWYVNVFGRRVDISKLINEELGQYAATIVNHIEALWYKAPQIEKCFLSGGGCILLKPYIEEYLQQNNLALKIDYVSEEDSLWGNVKGYAIIAQKLFNEAGDVKGWEI